MGYIEGCDRNQARIMCLDEMVERHSKTRVIDAFVDAIDLKGLGFTNTEPSVLGRSSYSPAHMVKLYMLGYERGVRSSRRLEALCRTDVEAMWVMEGLAPDFKTIADFRRDNKAAFLCLFSEFVSFLDMMGLLGKGAVALDGTKVKASDSRKRHVTKKGLEKARRYHEEKAAGYLGAMDEADDVEGAFDKAHDHAARAGECSAMMEEMDEAGKGAIALTDPDCAMMAASNHGTDIAYNVQAVVDVKAHMAVALSVSSSPTDHGELSHMLGDAQDILRKRNITGLADKGYAAGDDLAKCEELGIDCVVACQDRPTYAGRDPAFATERFTWDPDSDAYTCPAGQVLSCRSRKGTENRLYHAGKACRACRHNERCVPEGSSRRTMRRRPFSDVLDRARKRYEEDYGLYRRRQETVEHVFGTVKRAMGLGHLLLRGTAGAECEMALGLTGYNLKRALNELGLDALMAGIGAWAGLVGRARAFREGMDAPAGAAALASPFAVRPVQGRIQPVFAFPPHHRAAA
jgi:transposase